jgi:hypothetical protein
MSNLNDQQFGSVNCLDCGKPLEDGSFHVHLSNDDVHAWKSLAAAADAHHKADHAARYTPFNINDTNALRAHLKSGGHYFHPESVDNTEHEYLVQAHEDAHAEDDANYAPEEREQHTMIGNRHKHIEPS